MVKVIEVPLGSDYDREIRRKVLVGTNIHPIDLKIESISKPTLKGDVAIFIVNYRKRTVDPFLSDGWATTF